MNKENTDKLINKILLALNGKIKCKPGEGRCRIFKNPKKSIMKFSCLVSGDYELVLCEKCSQKEDRQFLIEEQQLNSQEMVE